MTTQTQIICAIRREEMMKGTACKANLYKEFIVRTIIEIIDGESQKEISKRNSTKLCQTVTVNRANNLP